MTGSKKHFGYGCGYVEDIRDAEHRQANERARRGNAPDGEAMRGQDG